MKLPWVTTLYDIKDVSKACSVMHKVWRECAESGKPCILELTTENKTRTNAANRLYWAKLRYLAQQLQPEGKRYTADAWHHYFRGMFIGMEDVPGGTQKPISTTTLSQAEFYRYIEEVGAFAAEFGVNIWEEE